MSCILQALTAAQLACMLLELALKYDHFDNSASCASILASLLASLLLH